MDRRLTEEAPLRTAKQAAQAEREAAALRENLRRRKQQARDRADGDQVADAERDLDGTVRLR